MSLTSFKTPHLLGGVSQLPQDQRQPTQLEVLENGLASVTHGLRKRPPTVDVGRISSTQLGYDDAYVHSVNRGPNERYTAVIANGDIKVFDTLSGAELPVFFPDGRAYLGAAGARGFRASTVGDHTFIVNRNKVVKPGSKKSPESGVYEALVFVRQVDFACEFSVTLEDAKAIAGTPAEETPGSRAMIATDVIAKALYDQLVDVFSTNFEFQLIGSTIHIRRKDGADFNIHVADGMADKGLRLIKGTVQTMEDLPARAREGFVLEVVGNPGSPKDNTWVIYEELQEGEGVWRETTKPGVLLDFDLSTMPHELVRQGYLSPLKPAADLGRQPAVDAPMGAKHTNGFTKDGSDADIGGTEADAHFVTDSGQAMRTPAVNGSHATQKRRVRIGFDIDTTATYGGMPADVVLRVNTGGGWTALEKKSYTAGLLRVNQTFDRVMVVPPGTRFELQLQIPLFFPVNGSGFQIVPQARKARLTAHGSSGAAPGVLIEELTATKIGLGESTRVWPMGTQVTLKIEGQTFMYELPDDLLTWQVHVALAALVSTGAGLVVTYTPPLLSKKGPIDYFEVSTAAGGAAAVTQAVVQFFAGTRMWNPDFAMTPGEHVGRTLRNLTDGSEGTVVANSARAFTVDALSGGRENRFRTGDECVVVDDGSAYFVFKKAPWGERLVGDDTLSPMPSCLHRKINEVFFHAGRLGFTSEDRVLLSATGDLYRFNRATVTQVLDDDPIDIQTAHQDVALLDSAVQWDGTLMLCSAAGHQFVLSGDPVLSPATARIDHMSSYPMSEKVRPIALGRTAVFPRAAGGFTQVRSVFRTRDGVDSDLLTKVVPKYIPGEPLSVRGDPDIGFLAVLASGDRQALYVYNFGQLGEWQQQAWSRWTFGSTVVSIDIFDGYLYLVLYRAGQVRLERINIASPPSPLSDHRDASSTPYTFKARLSRPHLRDRQGLPVTEGHTQLRTLTLQHHDTGYFRVEVTPANRSTKQYPALVLEGRKRVPVLAKNTAVTIDIINDSPSGCAISELTWEATYSNRS